MGSPAKTQPITETYHVAKRPNRKYRSRPLSSSKPATSNLLIIGSDVKKSSKGKRTRVYSPYSDKEFEKRIMKHLALKKKNMY